MSRVRDRTEDFKDAVRQEARSIGYDDKPWQRSPFPKAALKTLESIEELEQFLAKHRKDYVDLHRTTEQERDSTEQEVELSSLLDAVQEIETKMVEISVLNHLMLTHILQQAQQRSFV